METTQICATLVRETHVDSEQRRHFDYVLKCAAEERFSGSIGTLWSNFRLPWPNFGPIDYSHDYAIYPDRAPEAAFVLRTNIGLKPRSGQHFAMRHLQQFFIQHKHPDSDGTAVLLRPNSIIGMDETFLSGRIYFRNEAGGHDIMMELDALEHDFQCAFRIES